MSHGGGHKSRTLNRPPYTYDLRRCESYAKSKLSRLSNLINSPELSELSEMSVLSTSSSNEGLKNRLIIKKSVARQEVARPRKILRKLTT